MSKIDIYSLLLDKERILRVNLFLSSNDADRVSVMFKTENGVIPIISTSHGIITSENSVEIKGNCEYFQVFISYPDSIDSECIVSFFKQDSVHSESILFKSEQARTVAGTAIDFDIIKSSGKSFTAKMSNFQRSLSSSPSKWSVFLSIDDDIVINVRSVVEKNMVVSIGKISQDISLDDLIFRLEPGMKKLFLPKEWAMKRNIDDIVCCEIIKADFISFKNAYYKKQISNVINGHQLFQSTIRIVNTPTNSKFDNSWEINSLGLPEYKG